MTERILTCPRCRYPATIAEDVTGHLDWGHAVIDESGTIRPADPQQKPPTLTADNADATGRIRACCANDDCQHEWRPRRPFDPAPFPA
ncbi:MULTISPECIES: hypothetical protein [Streptomyces]|uniref:hypothetical protein n=1 Tax=Streptomyces TaxID=1883 RepID=UPI0016764244|nr:MULTISPECIES: hypothetical protein [Streptomyces]MBK3524857.1 hypothetical protein [Streptomyces sp. MBT70]GGR70890.1 hypothetical protein GCM10010236_26420 [Streptomyces eurythermus]